MKRIPVLTVLFMLLFSFSLQAQEVEKVVISEPETTFIPKDILPPMKKFNIGLDLGTDIWQDTPESMDIWTINRAVNVFATYNFPLGEGVQEDRWTFSPGLGIGVSNLWSDATPTTNSAGDSTIFVKIPDGQSYDNNKITFTTIDIPVELRYNNHKWHAAAFVKFRYNIAVHTKYKGRDASGAYVKVKDNRISHIEDWQIGAGFRFGYSWIHLYGYYSMTKIFTKDSGVDMYPIQVGITFLPFR